MKHAPEMMVALSEVNVTGLINLRKQPDESLNSIVGRLLNPQDRSKGKPRQHPSRIKTKIDQKYVCYLFDKPVHGKTLPEVFGNVIDVMHDLDPEALERLANTRISYRRFIISKDRRNIHLGRSDLQVTKSKSGWWHSKNVSQTQIKRALETLCKVAGLEFGVDIRWGENFTATDYPYSRAG